MTCRAIQGFYWEIEGTSKGCVWKVGFVVTSYLCSPKGDVYLTNSSSWKGDETHSVAD